MASNSFAFRRITDPLMVNVDTTAQQFTVPVGFFVTGPGQGATSFSIANPNNFWVRLRGSGDGGAGTGSYVPVTATTGWLFPPGFLGVFSTQYPRYMSAMSVTLQGLTAGQGTIEVSYGGGA